MWAGGAWNGRPRTVSRVRRHVPGHLVDLSQPIDDTKSVVVLLRNDTVSSAGRESYPIVGNIARAGPFDRSFGI